MLDTPRTNPDSDTGLSQHEIKRASQKLFYTGLAGLVLVLIYYVRSSDVSDVLHLYMGLVMITLGCLPGLLWALRSESNLPIFEAFMLTTVNAYAIPLLNGHRALVVYTNEDITSAAIGVLLFQAVAVSVYRGTKGYPKRTLFWTQEIVTEEISRYLIYGMTLTTIYTYLSIFERDFLFNVLPAESEGVLRAAFFGIGIVATFLACRRWGAKQLTQHDMWLFSLNFILQVLIQCATLYLIGAISLLVLAMLGYISSSRRLPLLLLGICVPLLAVMHNGKSVMRSKYWAPGASGIRLTDMPSLYTEWIQQGLKYHDPEEEQSSTARLLERTSLFHLMCLVTSVTPERQDYLWGETYKHIPAQFIPRYFWPDKPVGHISTYTLSKYYGLQSEDDTKKTTIGFGMLTEAYANFGFYGLAMIATLLAYSFRKVAGWASESPLVSYGGLVLVVLVAWSFQVELTLSIWLSSLYQALIIVLGVPLVVRSFGR